MRRTCPWRRAGGWLLGAVAAVSWLTVPPAAAGASALAHGPALGRLLLSAADVPSGWKKVTAPGANTTTKLGCVGNLANPGKGWHHVDRVFAGGKGLPSVVEGLTAGPGVVKVWRSVRTALAGCRSATITINGKSDRARIRALPFPGAATRVIATRWTLRATGLPLTLGVYLFRAGDVLGSLSFVDVGTLDVPDATAFATAAIAKAGGGAGTVRGVVDVVAAPVRVVRTPRGAVGYRTVGSGPPLVLVMGYGGSMETWEPGFVDALAHHFRVVLFDNAGIGKTAGVRAPLTIDRMAQQTSALIAALHLGAPDVLGWSMGGLIAEALAVLHPEQVHRLVLCATYPGTGAVRPPQSAVDDLDAGGSKGLAVLFPPGATPAATVFSVQTSQYASRSTVPARVVAAQAKAILQAWAGKDAALARYRDIAAPTLVADGATDRLVPAANVRTLAAGITGAKLLVYRDAGHAFLFQDAAAFVPAVVSFLSA